MGSGQEEAAHERQKRNAIVVDRPGNLKRERSIMAAFRPFDLNGIRIEDQSMARYPLLPALAEPPWGPADPHGHLAPCLRQHAAVEQPVRMVRLPGAVREAGTSVPDHVPDRHPRRHGHAGPSIRRDRAPFRALPRVLHGRDPPADHQVLDRGRRESVAVPAVQRPDLVGHGAELRDRPGRAHQGERLLLEPLHVRRAVAPPGHDPPDLHLAVVEPAVVPRVRPGPVLLRQEDHPVEGLHLHQIPALRLDRGLQRGPWARPGRRGSP